MCVMLYKNIQRFIKLGEGGDSHEIQPDVIQRIFLGANNRLRRLPGMDFLRRLEGDGGFHGGDAAIRLYRMPGRTVQPLRGLCNVPLDVRNIPAGALVNMRL